VIGERGFARLRPNDKDAHFDRTWAVQHRGNHDGTVLAEDPWRFPELEITDCDFKSPIFLWRQFEREVFREPIFIPLDSLIQGTASDRGEALDCVWISLDEIDQQSGLRIGFGAALFPVFERANIRPKIHGK